MDASKKLLWFVIGLVIIPLLSHLIEVNEYFCLFCIAGY